jgi:acyl carrier protein
MSDELIQRVISCIASSQKLPEEKITIDSTFEELGIDSLDGVNILFALENEFNINIPDEGAQGIRGVRQMVEALEKLITSGGPADAVAQNS